MPQENPRQLLVEGKEDVYAVAGLMQHFVEWGTGPDDWCVKIVPVGSDDELLAPSVLKTYAKQQEIEALGVLLDANDGLDAKWRRTQARLKEFLNEVPESLPPEGLIVQPSNLPRIGVWFMPDNRSRGMLETLLTFMVPDAEEPVWLYAVGAVAEAKQRGARYKVRHLDKAKIHTWLAWQDPPGDPLGLALKKKCLDPQSSCAAPFVAWFIKLFQLERRDSARDQ
jgi:hypothetical protein